MVKKKVNMIQMFRVLKSVYLVIIVRDTSFFFIVLK